MSILTKIFGDPNLRVLNKLQPIVEQINQLEPKFEKFSNEQLKALTPQFQERIVKGETLDDILPEAFAAVREAAKRTLGQRHFDVQLIGGMVLHQGEIAEMRTGEGKTLVATLPLYLNALMGAGCHLVTPNDYLSRHGAGWMGPVYNLLGASVGVIMHEVAFVYDPEYKNEQFADEYTIHLKPVSRQEAYLANITYGTNNEFGFDYLRDNMVMEEEQMVQRPLYYAIVDEVDSILIDEARTPLIISAPAEESTDKYYQFAHLVTQLEEGGDYNVDEKMRAATLTAAGISKMEKWLGVDNIYTDKGISEVHHIEQALRAHTLFKKDRDYVVREGEVIIVDEFTGRLMFGRRYSEGLHQAIEAKEGVEIKRESQTLATVTFQNYFRLYEKLAGMTGTAVTEAEEFSKIYNLEVVIIPTNKPMIRIDLEDRIYQNERAKFKAVVEEIKERNKNGQPVLVGTISIEKNELLGELLEREGVPHNILNAKHHEREAAIIADAGHQGAVTIATNMAGRGVDIILGGAQPPQDDSGFPKWQEEHERVVSLGGLHVIGTERHEARRIDNQLRGRSGRQGDPGSSQFYISMDDDLMRIFGSERMRSIMKRLGLPEDVPIENKMISKGIEAAQRKVEGNNFDIRKHLVEYDDVINKHREVIYKKRREILAAPQTLREKILAMVEDEIEQVVLFHTSENKEGEWNIEEIYEVANTIFPVPPNLRIKLGDIQETAGTKIQDAQARTRIIEYLSEIAQETYQDLGERLVKASGDEGVMQKVEQRINLRAIDTLWIEHLEAIDHLRTGIGLRGYGQRDPLVEYKREAYRLFNELINNVQRQIVYSIYKIGVAAELAPTLMQRGGVQLSAPAKEATDKSSPFAQRIADRNSKGVEALASQQKFRDEAGRNSKGVEALASQQKFRDEAGRNSKGVEALASQQKFRDEAGRKVGRNDPCPCGSGKKFKKCHGK